MATIGRKRTVVQLGRLKLSGFPAWALWSIPPHLLLDRISQPTAGRHELGLELRHFPARNPAGASGSRADEAMRP